MGKMKYREIIRVNSHDTDCFGELRPSALVRYVQETVYLQFCNNPPSLDTLRYSHGKTFVISKYKMKVLKPLHTNDIIKVYTWALPSRAFSFLRAAQVKMNGEVVALFHMCCALIDIEKKSLCRVNSVEFGFGECDEDIGISSVGRIKLPNQEELVSLGSRKILLSDIDANMHMNNTNYPDMLCNFIEGIENYRAKEFEIDFLNEAPYLENVDLLSKTQNTDDGIEVYFKTYCLGKNNVNAHFLFEKR